MTIHVGSNPYTGKLKLFDDVKKETKAIEIGKVKFNEIEKVNAMFTEIKLKINGNLGCACFCLYDDYGNEIRKKIIEEGQKCGFKNVEIIDEMTAVNLYAMSQIPYQPLNNDVIWIYSAAFIFVWQIKDHKAKFMDYWRVNSCEMDNLRNIAEKSKCKRGPDVFLCLDSHEYQNKIIEKNVEQLSKKCQFFKYTFNYSFVDGALIKARIKAGDADLAHLDVYNYLSQKIILKIDKKEIMAFEEGQQLPINYSQKIITEINDTELVVISSAGTESFKLQNYKTFNLKFKVDENGIYSVNFESTDETQKRRYKNQLIPINDMKIMTFSNRDELSAKNYTFAIPTKEILIKSKIEIIGIDLGTSRCCAAVNRKNGIATFPLDNKGERLLPSYVAYNEQNPIFGQVAVNRLRQFSKSTIFDSKRIIGRKFNDIEIDSNWNFTVSLENDQIYIEFNGFNGRKKITAEEVAADLLKHIKQKAEDYQGCKLPNVVITVPAAFTEQQKVATIKAAELSGWKTIHLLPEPIAAAFAYFIDRPFTKNSTMLLFDLGGGTLDVCIFKIVNDKIKIISNTGDSKFGGRDFDTLLINYFKNALSTGHGISNLRDKKYRLMLECQRIKEDLSTVMESSLDVNDFDANTDGIISLNREEFQQMSQALLNKIKNTIHAALFEVDYKTDQINKVLQVGGGSRMPMIKKLLLDIFPNAEHCCEEHPDEVVAIGAAYYAYHIFCNQ